MLLKGQLHAHSSLSDGSLSPQELVRVYEDLGFDFLAITDHDHLLKSSYYDTLRKIDTRLILFLGIELTVHCTKGYVHVGRIEGDNQVLHIFNHLSDYNLGLKEILQCIREVSARYPLDAVEVTHHGFYAPEFDIAEIGYPRIAADDSHNINGCGRGWIEVECAPDKDTIIEAIRAGKHKNRIMGKPECFSGKIQLA
jgi:hypothetical protein